MNGNIPDSNSFEEIIKSGFTKIILLSSCHGENHKMDSEVLLSLI